MSLESGGGRISQSRVSAFCVVVAFDVLKAVEPGLMGGEFTQ
jgi:hypothetical protein